MGISTNQETLDDFAKFAKYFAQALNSYGGKTVEILIDASTYDALKNYADRMNEPLSVIATKAVKKYIDVGDYNGTNKL